MFLQDKLPVSFGSAVGLTVDREARLFVSVSLYIPLGARNKAASYLTAFAMCSSVKQYFTHHEYNCNFHLWHLEDLFVNQFEIFFFV